jgi:hypothetical protein
MRVNPEAGVEVETVCGCPVGSDARVEVDLPALEASGFVVQPFQQEPCMPLLPRRGKG